MPDDQLSDLQDRARWVAERAGELDLVRVEVILESDRRADGSLAAALGGYQVAKDGSAAFLFTDDPVLRAIARTEGVDAFGTLGVLYVLMERGHLSAEGLAAHLLTLRRCYCADLPPDANQIVALAEEEGWRAGPALFAFSRAAIWRRPETLSLFKGCVKSAAAVSEELPSRWLYAGIVGLSAISPPGQLQAVAASLLISVAGEVGLDAEQFARLTESAQGAVRELGGSDPLPAVLNAYLAAFSTRMEPQPARQALLVLCARLEDENRDTVRRVVFGTGNG
jgi:hypothetical protein